MPTSRQAPPRRRDRSSIRPVKRQTAHQLFVVISALGTGRPRTTERRRHPATPSPGRRQAYRTLLELFRPTDRMPQQS